MWAVSQLDFQNPSISQKATGSLGFALPHHWFVAHLNRGPLLFRRETHRLLAEDSGDAPFLAEPCPLVCLSRRVLALARLWHDWNARGYAERGEGAAARTRGPSQQSQPPARRSRGAQCAPQSPSVLRPALAPCPDTRAFPSPSRAGWGEESSDPASAGGYRETEREKCLPREPLSVGPPRPLFSVFLPVPGWRLRGRGERKRRGRSGSARGMQRRGRALGFRACSGRPGVPAAPAARAPGRRRGAGAAACHPLARRPWCVLSPVGGGRRTCSGLDVDGRAARSGKSLIKPQLDRPD